MLLKMSRRRGRRAGDGALRCPLWRRTERPWHGRCRRVAGDESTTCPSRRAQGDVRQKSWGRGAGGGVCYFFNNTVSYFFIDLEHGVHFVGGEMMGRLIVGVVDVDETVASWPRFVTIQCWSGWGKKIGLIRPVCTLVAVKVTLDWPTTFFILDISSVFWRFKSFILFNGVLFIPRGTKFLTPTRVTITSYLLTDNPSVHPMEPFIPRGTRFFLCITFVIIPFVSIYITWYRLDHLII